MPNLAPTQLYFTHPRSTTALGCAQNLKPSVDRATVIKSNTNIDAIIAVHDRLTSMSRKLLDRNKSEKLKNDCYDHQHFSVWVVQRKIRRILGLSRTSLRRTPRGIIESTNPEIRPCALMDLILPRSLNLSRMR